ncbi:MAG: hypothetical protein IT204_11855 [Fimbriimonadaceae bacterium]|nr:hypothetical protein [Fimbriimonadaceae bacterium]
MRTWRRWMVVLGGVGALALAGCGGGGGGGDIRSRMAGTWILRAQSDDSGVTYDEVTNGFTFTLYSDGDWSDSTGDSGTWSIWGDEIRVDHSNTDPDEQLPFRLEDGDDQLRIFVPNDANTAWERISVYRRNGSGDVEIIRSHDPQLR